MEPEIYECRKYEDWMPSSIDTCFRFLKLARMEISRVRNPNGEWEAKGITRGFDSQGNLRKELYYEHGKIHGIHTQWYPNGQIQDRVNVVKNTREGTFEAWHENGTRRCLGELKGNFPMGIWKYWRADGSFEKSEIYGSNGRIQRVVSEEVG